MYSLVKRIVWPVLKLFIKQISGLENLPNRSCVLVANHSSYIDGALLILLIAQHKNKQLCALATNKKFTGFFWNLLFFYFGAIRVNGSVKKAIIALKKGKWLLLFPEGGRTPSGKLTPVKHTGMGVISTLTQAPVVPIGLNTFHFWNKNQLVPNFKKNISIVIGKPMYFKGRLTKEKINQVKKAVWNEVKHCARMANSQ